MIDNEDQVKIYAFQAKEKNLTLQKRNKSNLSLFRNH